MDPNWDLLLTGYSLPNSSSSLTMRRRPFHTGASSFTTHLLPVFCSTIVVILAVSLAMWGTRECKRWGCESYRPSRTTPNEVRGGGGKLIVSEGECLLIANDVASSFSMSSRVGKGTGGWLVGRCPGRFVLDKPMGGRRHGVVLE